MGCQQAHKADEAGKTDHGGHHQCGNQQNCQPQKPHIDTQHSGFTLFRRKQDYLPVEQKQNRHADYAQQQIAADGIDADAV